MACPLDTTCSIFGLGIANTRDGFLEEINAQVDKMVGAAATEGDQVTLVYSSVRDLSVVLGEAQASLREAVGNTNVFPIIVANDGEFPGVGTSFTLYRKDGSTETVRGATQDYYFYKSLARAPVGIFSIIAPYFNAPDSTNWIPALEDALTKVKVVQKAVGDAPPKSLNGELSAHANETLKVVEEFVSERIAAKKVTLESFQSFGKKIYPLFMKARERAALNQVETSIPALRKFKESLGDDWKNVYVIVPTVWHNAGANGRKLILQEVLEKENQNSHIILSENVKNIKEARTVVGRAVTDRAFAQLFFESETTKERRNLTFEVSTTRDFMTDAIVVAIEEFNAIKIDIEVKTQTVFDVDFEDEDEDAPAPKPKPTPKPEEDPLNPTTSRLVEV